MPAAAPVFACRCRYNMSDLERSSLVELLAMLKGLHSTLHAACGDPSTLIMRGIHEWVQRFVHETMGGPTRKAVKYDKRALKAALLQVRNMVADWYASPPPPPSSHMLSTSHGHCPHRTAVTTVFTTILLVAAAAAAMATVRRRAVSGRATRHC